MVLKEYLLRGMANRYSSSRRPRWCGQWQEEMETKFGLDFTTTYDALLRADAAAFWAQPRVIASIATARRREHMRGPDAGHASTSSSSTRRIISRTARAPTGSWWTRSKALPDAAVGDAGPEQPRRALQPADAAEARASSRPRRSSARLLKPGKPRLPANPEGLRELLRDVMVRNTRAVAALKLPRRHASTLRVEPAPGEAEAYAAQLLPRGLRCLVEWCSAVSAS